MKDFIFYGSLSAMVGFAIIARMENFAVGPLVMTAVCLVVAIGSGLYSDWQNTRNRFVYGAHKVSVHKSRL